MKLIYLTNARIPTEKAHGYQICKMCEEFAKSGLEVELWVPTRKNEIKEDAFSYYGIENNFKIKEIKSFDFLRLDLGRFSFYLHEFWFMFKLFFLKAEKSALIYARESEIAWLFKFKGHKTILEAHNWPGHDFLFKFFAKRLEKIVVISHGLKEKFLANGWREEKILVAPDGVDLAKFDIMISKEQARKKLNLPLDKNIILYTGHLYEWKGAQDLSEAASCLPAQCLTVFVGGTKADALSFKKINRSLIEDGKIALYEQQKHAIIPFWLKAADILVLPNKSFSKISKYYTSPLKLFEYLASNRPIVASNLPALREILNENNCLFFKPDNPKDLADKIKILLNDHKLTASLVDKSYACAKNYSWERRVKMIKDFIK